MTDPLAYPDQLLAQTAWLQRLSRELVPADSAADLAQETLAAALERPQPKHAHVRAWLERIARNLAAGRTRARYRRLRREARTARADAQPATADTIAQFEVHRAVVDAVQALREPMRTTLLLRYWEDLPPREIAVRMQAPVETVRTRIKRGLDELRGRLDRRHGEREAWCGTLLSISFGPAAAAAPAVATASGIGLFMHSKTLAVGAIATIGLLGAIAWNSAAAEHPGDSGWSTGSGRTLGAAKAVSNGDPSADTLPVRTGAATRTETEAAGAPKPTATAAWLTGRVFDDALQPIADVEVAYLSEDVANTHGRYDGLDLSSAATQVLRSRWALWHLSDRGWMKERAVLNKVFGTERITRTDSGGGFRLGRRSAGNRGVLALWSPEIGMRFHPVASLSSAGGRVPERVVCPRWPKLRGQLTADAAISELAKVFVDPEGPEVPRVLQFFTDASGRFETPQIPPGAHSIQLILADHFAVAESFDLQRDRTINRKLVPFPRLRVRLVDVAGAAWTRSRLEQRGWSVDQLQFVMLREERPTKTDLDADFDVNRSRTTLRFSADDGVMDGAVDDPRALILSIWQSREHVASVHLPSLDVEQVVLDIPRPRTATRLGVSIRLAAQGLSGAAKPKVRVELGALSGLGRYTFERASMVEGAGDAFQVDVPGFLRGQAARLVVTASGFADRILDVPIPLQGVPQPIHVELPRAPHALEVRVVDENNRPIADARLKIATANGTAFRGLRRSIGRTGEDGTFVFGELAPFRVRVFASARDRAATSGVALSSQAEPFTIRMLPGVERRIDAGPLTDEIYAMRILDPRGMPLLDDRHFGAGHSGQTLQTFRMRLAAHAQTLELWLPGAAKPSRVISLR